MNKNDIEQKKGPVWRESASLIICVRSPQKYDGYDYEILMLKRSDRTALAPNQCVFPGGIYDPFDESIEWLKYFEEFGISQQSLQQLILTDCKQGRPSILAPQGTGCYDRFFKSSKIWAREISLRINAIRETFEEVGILLCRNRDQLKDLGHEGYFEKSLDRTEWQKAVHNDPRNFLKMCRELKVIPDLWGLHEWSCWASPAIVKKGYETVFYATFLNEKPEVVCEVSEVKEHLWLPPFMFLEMMRNGDIFFLSAQYYELARFMSSKSFNYLRDFAKERGGKGITSYLPIVYVCTDGLAFVLPGDDQYTGSPRLATIQRKVEFTTEEFRAHTKRIHRLENAGTPDAEIYLNIEPLDDHLNPVSEDHKRKHKL